MTTYSIIHEQGKIHSTIKGMNRLNFKILRIREVRWPSFGKSVLVDKTLHYSSNDIRNYLNGVGIMVSKRFEPVVVQFVLVSS